MFFKNSVKSGARMSANNFFRHSPTRDSQMMSTSTLVENNNKVLAGGTHHILRMKKTTTTLSAASSKPLFNDITKLVQEFHRNDSRATLREVSPTVVNVLKV